MNLLTSYLLAVSSLFLGADPGIYQPGNDALQPGEWLLFETLDLQHTGPCYDVAFYQDDIIFLKSGEETLYLAPIVRPDPSYSQPLSTNRDISCSPAALSFSAGFTRGYYTRPVVGNEQKYMEKIFEMSIEDDKVSGLSQVSFSNDPSRTLHPAVSSDGSLMVFSSDRRPTSGGLDLFVTRLTADGWSQPVNLGESINTSGHEWFPFLDKMNNLWFSSTGHSGYGGFDVFVCPYKEQEWGLPQNLGKVINGPQNELGFSVHPQKQVALFSRTWTSEPKGMAIMLTLNEEALDAAGIDEISARDIALVMQGMADPASPASPLPQVETKTVPELETQPETQAESIVNADPNPVVFRVQIISSLYENSFPKVFVDGKSYSTYEYFYLGSYRITVGKFDSLQDANAFRLRCLDSGFKQAFVAAFRGDKRETDPSVYK
jgi:hypothetical protein